MATLSASEQLQLIKDRLPRDYGERRFVALIDAMAYSVLVKHDNIIVYANQAAARLLKAENADELIGLPSSEFWHPEDREDMQGRRNRILASHDPLSLQEQRRRCLDGTSLWVESSGVHMEWSGRAATLSVFRVVTDRHQAEVDIKQRQEEYRQLVQRSPDPMMVASQGRIVFANPAAYDAFGANAENPLEDFPLSDIIVSADAEWADDSAMSTEAGPFSPIELHKIDGTPLIGDASRARVSWEGKRAIQVIIHNVTSKWHLAQLMRRQGETELDDKDLLELFLWRSLRGGSTGELAEQLINQFGDFPSVVSADVGELATVEGLDLPVIMKLKSIPMAVTRLTKNEIIDLPILNNRTRLERYLRAAMSHKKQEELRLLLLDVKQQLIMDKVLHRGTVDQAPLYPREVVRRALTHSASAIILAHNHPSGDPTPSAQDIETTRKIQAAAEMLDIAFHDHLIITRAGISSLRDMGMLDDDGKDRGWKS